MAKIRQTTNWDDPAAAEKANAEIKKLAGQLHRRQVTHQVPRVISRLSQAVAIPGI